MKKRRIILAVAIMCIVALFGATLCACDLSQFFGVASSPKDHYIIDITNLTDISVANVVANNSMEKAVRIETSFTDGTLSIGSGFVISETGHILTNAHCVEPSPQTTRKGLVVKFVSGIRYFDAQVEVLKVDANLDIAVLKIASMQTDKKFQFFEFAPLATQEDGKKKETLRYGEMCFTIGHPENIGFLFSSAMVSSPVSMIKSGNGAEIETIILDSSINHGNSGGPLINASSQAIGMVNARVESKEGINNVYGIGLAIPRTVIFKYLDKENIPYVVATPPTTPPTPAK